MLQNSIVVVDDDADDCEILVASLQDIGVKNEIRCFKNGATALEYLKKANENPFIIISDINMPGMNGLEFKKYINEDASLSKREIPFVFLSTSKEQNLLRTAFQLGIQGYFQKQDDFESMKEVVQAIVGYWKNSSFLPVVYKNDKPF